MHEQVPERAIVVQARDGLCEQRGHAHDPDGERLHGRQRDGFDGIVDGIRVVGKSARVDDDAGQNTIVP